MANEPRTLCDIFTIAAASGKPNLLISKVDGVWKPIPAADFGFTVRALSLGLNGLGVQPGDRVAILSENRPEWAMADYAILCAGAWSVPIYPTLPAAQIAPLLNDCGAKAIFVSSLEQLGKILTIKAQCPTLDHVILIDGNPPGEPGYTTFHGVVDRGRSDPRDEPGRLRAARRPRAAGGRRDDHLHLRHDGGAQGRDADPRQPRRRTSSPAARSSRSRPTRSRSRSCRCRTSSSGCSTTPTSTRPPRSRTPSRSTSSRRTSPRSTRTASARCPGSTRKSTRRSWRRRRPGARSRRRSSRGRVAVGKERVPYVERKDGLPAALARKAKIADALVFKKIRAALGANFRFAVSGGAPLSRTSPSSSSARVSRSTRATA